MKAFARTLAAVALLAVVSACGSDSGQSSGSSGSTDGTGQTTSGESSPSNDAARVVTVSVHQTGGLKPTDELRVFSADSKPPAGYTRQDVEHALAAADALAASNVVQPRLPNGMCADCYSFAITLTFADGSATSYLVTQGVQQPPVLSDLLSATS